MNIEFENDGKLIKSGEELNTDKDALELAIRREKKRIADKEYTPPMPPFLDR